MADIRNIDITKINPNGRYIDLVRNTIIDLTDEQIQSLRKFYNDETIAINRSIKKYEEPPRVTTGRVIKSSTNHKNYRLTREQKYNKGRHVAKTNPQAKFGKLVIIGSLVVCVFLGSKFISNDTTKEKIEISDLPSVTYTTIAPEGLSKDNLLAFDRTNIVEEPTIESTNYEKENLETDIALEDKEETIDDNIDEITDETLDDTISEPVYNERELLIKNICDIYQVNYDKVYNHLMDITDNFSNENYLNGIIPGVTCKGVEVKASSEEELLVYAIRCMKQLPNNMGITTDNLYINNGYVSDTNYMAQLTRVANVLGVDRCLLYAVVNSECGFNSELFNEKNNPAGIKATNGKFWAFDTKEEGFFELGMELLKYYRKIGVSPDHLDYDTLSKIRDIHAPLVDNNDHWLPNVTSSLEYAQLHEAEIFDSIEEINGLSK